MATQLEALRQAQIEARTGVTRVERRARLEDRLTMLIGANIFLTGLAFGAAVMLASKLSKISDQLTQIASKLH